MISGSELEIIKNKKNVGKGVWLLVLHRLSKMMTHFIVVFKFQICCIFLQLLSVPTVALNVELCKPIHVFFFSSGLVFFSKGKQGKTSPGCIICWL